MGEFIKDPAESLDLSVATRLYCVLATFWLSFAYGRSTPTFLERFVGLTDSSQLTNAMQPPALALLLASIGSCGLCGFLLAPERNRSSFIWAVKGFLGGPLTIRELRELETLITRGEQEEIGKANSV